MHKYLHVSIWCSVPISNFQEIEKTASLLTADWLRYNMNSWVFWTDKSPITVSEMMKNHILPSDQILVFVIDREFPPTGLMPAWVWSWFNRPRDVSTGVIGSNVPNNYLLNDI